MPSPLGEEMGVFNELIYTNLSFLQIFTLIKLPVKPVAR